MPLFSSHILEWEPTPNWLLAHVGRTFFNDFLCSNIVIESNTLKKDRGKIIVCAMRVLPWLFQSSTHSLWEWHAIIISFNLLDVSTCCSLLQFVFNFKKRVYSFDAKHWQNCFRAPFPVEFRHGKKGWGHSASAVCQVTPSEQGVPLHYTSSGCLFEERVTP